MMQDVSDVKTLHENSLPHHLQGRYELWYTLYELLIHYQYTFFNQFSNLGQTNTKYDDIDTGDAVSILLVVPLSKQCLVFKMIEVWEEQESIERSVWISHIVFVK